MLKTVFSRRNCTIYYQKKKKQTCENNSLSQNKNKDALRKLFFEGRNLLNRPEKTAKMYLMAGEYKARIWSESWRDSEKMHQ